MPERTSIFTDAVTNVVGFVTGLKEDAAKANPIPFMEKRVPLRDARAQWEKMGPEQRREYIKSHSLEAALKRVRPPKSKGFAGAQSAEGENEHGETI